MTIFLLFIIAMLLAERWIHVWELKEVHKVNDELVKALESSLEEHKRSEALIDSAQKALDNAELMLKNIRTFSEN